MRLLKASEIELRAQTVTEKGSSWLLYKTARTDMDILDETVGPNCWQCDYKTIKDNMYCGIGVKCDDEWVWKWDCGIESNTEAEKGEASDSFKRAGFKWGIGRELYTAPFIWIASDKIPTEQNKVGKWQAKGKPDLVEIEYTENAISYIAIKYKGEIIYEYGDKKIPVNDMISLIKQKMTPDNALQYYRKAIKLYPKGTEEYKKWKKIWAEENDKFKEAKTVEQLAEEQEFLDNI